MRRFGGALVDTIWVNVRSIHSRTSALFVILILLLCDAIAAASSPLAIKAKMIHVGNGTTIENGVVLIEGGRIQAVGQDVVIPTGTNVIEIDEGCITPGLIDANARLEASDLIDDESFAIRSHARQGRR